MTTFERLVARGPLTIDALGGSGQTLVISFSSIGHDPARPPSPEFVRTSTDQGRPALFVMDAARRWGQGPDFLTDVRAAICCVATRQPITQIVAIGASMGAYTALFAAQSLPIDLVVAFGPQAHLGAQEARWLPWSQGMELPPPGVPGPNQRWVIAHGLVDDHAQAMGFAPAPGLDHILFPALSHSDLGAHLKHSGVIKGLLSSAIAGDRRRMLRIAGSAGGQLRQRLGI